MAKIDRKSAELIEGILGIASGTPLPITFVRKGVIRGLKESIYVKRPNQYVSKSERNQTSSNS